MSGLSRRELIRASAGAAAVAVPMSALSAGGASAFAAGSPHADAEALGDLELEGPVMLCVRDGRTGEASILHGTDEVIVRDRQLVNRILRAAKARQAV